ncbi:PadR family transcriptional regulator [Nisaea acidiphila]|uniref:PadR family transcriptional regulator n=1 Tax=Nisaea acidiphila TaxID=1862145 RepID=A0A9J7B0H1_9PROT|nr:PadR family transcriptional regulator [Nisaea acidiphila]UUX52153.1 PadR family transcriptional regulator [Nisaea acidiphila]
MFEISHIILGALVKGPANGYQIRRRINTDFAHFQSVSTGALYPALAKLKARGAVIEVGAPTQSLEQRNFEITDLGRDELRRQVEMSGSGERLKSDFLAAVNFADLAGPDEVERLLEERVGVLNQEIRSLLALPLRDMSNTERFTVRYALAVRRAALEFLRHEGRAIVTAIDIESRKSIS